MSGDFDALCRCLCHEARRRRHRHRLWTLNEDAWYRQLSDRELSRHIREVNSIDRAAARGLRTRGEAVSFTAPKKSEAA